MANSLKHLNNDKICTYPVQPTVLARPAGFTVHISAMVKWLFSTLHRKVQKYLEHQNNRRIVSEMLQLDDAILADMNLTRADLHQVLATRSKLQPTERLKLLALQRRTINQADAKRRADYLEHLVPAFHMSTPPKLRLVSKA